MFRLINERSHFLCQHNGDSSKKDLWKSDIFRPDSSNCIQAIQKALKILLSCCRGEGKQSVESLFFRRPALTHKYSHSFY